MQLQMGLRGCRLYNTLNGLCSDATYFLMNETPYSLMENESQKGGWGGWRVSD